MDIITQKKDRLHSLALRHIGDARLAGLWAHKAAHTWSYAGLKEVGEGIKLVLLGEGKIAAADLAERIEIFGAKHTHALRKGVKHK